MRLIVAGGRDFNDYDLMKRKLDHFLQNQTDVEIVSGKARGADFWGEQYAKEKGYPIKPFPADWEMHGKAAGFIRNQQMADYATHCICFWDGKSRGTKMMIEICARMRIPYRIVLYNI